MSRAMTAVGVTAIASLMIAAPASAEPEGDVSALSCYGSAKSFTKPAGHYDYPTGTGILTTTSNCADINLKSTTTRSVQVCFLPSSGDPYCQPNYKSAPAGQWTVIATNVANGTKFFFWFASSAVASGQWAA